MEFKRVKIDPNRNKTLGEILEERRAAETKDSSTPKLKMKKIRIGMGVK